MTRWNDVLLAQLDATITTLGNAIRACPERTWEAPCGGMAFWHAAFHTLFWLDVYSDESLDAFEAPEAFGRSEFEEGAVPPRTFAKEELLAYLEHGRAKARGRVEGLTDADLARSSGFPWLARRGISVVETVLYDLRHVQHHAAQLNLVLRQVDDVASPWVPTRS